MRTLTTAFALALAATPAMAAPWQLSVDREMAMLTDADDTGEDADTSLRCTPKSGKIIVHFFTDERVANAVKAGTLSAASGAVRAQFPAKATPEEMYGGNEVEATIPANAPVIAAFAKTGVLRLVAWGQTARGARVPVAKAAGIVKACSKP